MKPSMAAEIFLEMFLAREQFCEQANDILFPTVCLKI